MLRPDLCGPGGRRAGGGPADATAPAAPAQRADLRASSLPQSLAAAAQQQQLAEGIDPGAPASPHPTAALRRASSTPLQGGQEGQQSHDSAASMHPHGGSSGTDCDHSTSEAGGSGSSKEGSQRRGTQHAAAPRAAAAGAAAGAPTHAGLLHQQEPARQQQVARPDPQPARHVSIPVPLPAAPSAEGICSLQQDFQAPPSPAVSLLSLQLRGSAASSAATSREPSVRRGST